MPYLCKGSHSDFPLSTKEMVDDMTEANKVWVLVDTVLTYRLRYCVQTTKPEYALDDVVMETPKEFSQLPIGEQIISHRVVSEEEALAICDVDNDYTKGWSKEQKMRAFFTKEGENRNDI